MSDLFLGLADRPYIVEQISTEKCDCKMFLGLFALEKFYYCKTA